MKQLYCCSSYDSGEKKSIIGDNYGTFNPTI
jgi:hypothetical protein